MGLRHVLDDDAPEGPECEDAELEGLDPERDADDRRAEEEPGDEMPDEELPSEKEQPEDIEYDGEAPARVRSVHDATPEGPERELRELECLYAERNADDRQAQDEARQTVAHCEPQTAEEEPEDVTDDAHGRRTL